MLFWWLHPSEVFLRPPKSWESPSRRSRKLLLVWKRNWR
ncbi:hypothetical protein EVA_07588 [gut metagenome]|uniref:Uncharacterized protein n=1 Tax=gut metagenome TaxID=749906 RepID=J9GPH1_9ZZZZ